MARAQTAPARGVPLVGILLTTPLTEGMSAQTVGILRAELARGGFVDGRNMRLVVRSADGDPDRLGGLAKDLVAHQASVLCPFGPAAIRAARAATATLPIVALDLETDPVRAGWAQTLARPGGNITGLFIDLSVLTGKWLELLRAAVPRITRVALLWDATTGSAQLDAMRAIASRLRIDVHVLRFSNSTEMSRVLTADLPDRVDALAMLSSPMVRNSSRLLADFSREARLPAISPFAPFAQFGGLMAYGPDLTDFFRRCAAFVSKILAGADPAEIPIEQPTKFEMVLNVKTAAALGLAVSQELLLRADAVIR